MTPHKVVCTTHSDIFNAHYEVATAHKEVFTAHNKVFTAHKEVFTAHNKVFTAHKEVFTAHNKVCTAHKEVSIAHKVVCTTHNKVVTARNEVCNYRSKKKTHLTAVAFHTELSKYIWTLKDARKPFRVQWKVLATCKSYDNMSKKCNLYLKEIFFIICRNDLCTLNKRNELASSCPHRNRFTLKNFKIR